MIEFRVTFGQRFAYDEHPTFPAAHPDGWMTIEADTYEQARAIALRVLGQEWAFLYAADFADHYFPRGELGRVARDQVP